MRLTDRFSRVLPIVAAALTIFSAATLAGIDPARGQAKQNQHIVALVNDDVVSGRDLDRRVDLIMRTARLPENPETRARVREQAMRMLIDEHVQIQEGARRQLGASDGEIANALRRIEQQNKLPPGGMDDFLRSMGLEKESLVKQIEAEIVWGKVMRQRAAAMVNVTEDEVMTVVDRIKNTVGKTENLVNEIVLAVDTPEQDAEVKAAILRLYEQLKAGASFSAAARQFSQGVTAASGGDVGWVQAGGLPAEIELALAQMQPGDVSPPIRGANGYYIVALRDRRQIATGDPNETRFTLKQILIPIAPEADAKEVEKQTQTAARIAAELKGCANVETVGQANKIADAGPIGTVKLGELPPTLKTALANMVAGQVTAPLRTSVGVQVLAVCGRSDPTSGIDPEQIRASLFSQKTAMLARRYLRDLRREALIEIR